MEGFKTGFKNINFFI